PRRVLPRPRHRRSPRGAGPAVAAGRPARRDRPPARPGGRGPRRPDDGDRADGRAGRRTGPRDPPDAVARPHPRAGAHGGDPRHRCAPRLASPHGEPRTRPRTAAVLRCHRARVPRGVHDPCRPGPGPPTASDSPARHAGALMGTVCAYGLGVGAWAAASGTVLPDMVGDQTRTVDVVLLLVVVVAVIGLCTARSRIAAVVLLSAAGIAVTIQIFALGAPDVGLTQLLVEALTIIVCMLGLRHLPRDFIAPSRTRRTAGIALGLASGIAATAAVLVFAGRRERSPIGMYLLEQGPEITGGSNVVNT